MQLKLKIRGKITLIFTLVTVVGLVVFSILVTSLIRNEATNRVVEKTKSDLSIGNILLEASYRGEWKTDNGKLYKGNSEINENYILIDVIKKVTGDDASIFLNDTLITTTIQKDGKRIVGTKASAEVMDNVLEKGQTYYSENDIAGVKYYAGYIPIKDRYGKIMGMFFLGIPKSAAANAVNSSVYFQIFLVCLLIILVIIAVSYAFANLISKQVNHVSQAMGYAEKGDFTRKINLNTSDEFGELANSYHKMLANIRKLIGEVMDIGSTVYDTSKNLAYNAAQATKATEQVATAMNSLVASNDEQKGGVEKTTTLMNQLNESIKQIKQGANEQASNVTETANTMEQMVNSIEEVAGMAQHLAEATGQTTEVANKGKVAVEKTMAEMEQIKTSVFDTAGKIQNLGEKSNQIGEIIQVIDEIAGQTNLLALNAAIEAARAGEHGKGFAVVADEVRKLAERSGKATKEIAELITAIQKETESAVSAMSNDTQEVELGVQLAHEAAQALGNIITMIDEATQQVTNISTSTEYMASNSSLVLDSVNQVSSITEENLTATEEMATGSDEVVNSITSLAGELEQSANTTENVSASAEELTASSQEVAAYAGKLAEASEQLKNSIEFFKIGKSDK